MVLLNAISRGLRKYVRYRSHIPERYRGIQQRLQMSCSFHAQTSSHGSSRGPFEFFSRPSKCQNVAHPKVSNIPQQHFSPTVNKSFPVRLLHFCTHQVGYHDYRRLYAVLPQPSSHRGCGPQSKDIMRHHQSVAQHESPLRRPLILSRNAENCHEMQRT